MAKITALDVADELTGEEHLPIVQRGNTKRVTMAAFRSLITPYLQTWYKGDRGDTGAANSTYITAAELTAAAITKRSYIFAPENGVNDGLAAGTFLFRRGDYSSTKHLDGFANGHIVQLDGVPLTTGALVRQEGGGVSFSNGAAAGRGTVGDVLNRQVLATSFPFFARGDGVADDSDAIQAAVDYVESLGGGTVVLPITLAGKYRTTRTIYVGSYVFIDGYAPQRYAYNAGHPSVIEADFTDPMQWIIDTKTTHNGQRFAYDEVTTDKVGAGGGLPNGAIMNGGVRNITITAKGKLPYGGIRRLGNPGSIVENVAIDNVGTGLFLNCCFGGEYKVHCLVAYYGVVAWEDMNGNDFQIYCARKDGYAGVVPDAYQTVAMKQMYGKLSTVHGLAKEDHFNRAIGLVFGATYTTSNTNVICYVGERFSTGLFTLYAYATNFAKFYVESSPNQMLTAVAGARSGIIFSAFHAYLSGAGEFFDTGISQHMKLIEKGLTSAGAWGRVREETSTSMQLHGVTFEQFGPDKPQYNIFYLKIGQWHTIVLQAPFVNADRGLYFDASYALRQGFTKIRGSIKSGLDGVVGNGIAFVVPPGYRPGKRLRFTIRGGLVVIDPDGAGYVYPDNPNDAAFLASFDGIEWEANQ